MHIKVKNGYYELFIRYYYRDINNDLKCSWYYDLSSFEEFINENHPGVDISELSALYTKKLDFLNGLSDSIVDEKYKHNYCECFICDNVLTCSSSSPGIEEKMREHYKRYDELHDGYLYTFLANSWEFKSSPDGGYKIKYWFDSSNKKKTVYKIHAFRDKVVFDDGYDVIASVINTSQYYIYYDGKKKNG
jgi:hypothetical protein